jgi:hypothetical protein
MTGGSKFLKSKEVLGRFVGIAEHQGDILTYLILTYDTLQVITRSSIWSTLGPDNKNMRASPDAGETGNGNGRKSIVMSMKNIAAIAMEPSDLFLTLGTDLSTRHGKWTANACQSLVKDYGHRR